ncbi:hypothetical protein C8R45DRAFT_260778 [Mycena sanguinolenta]|nr:hypothetical protein C8R45DRAFT_260778 [Mycena sanguinolenta]
MYFLTPKMCCLPEAQSGTASHTLPQPPKSIRNELCTVLHSTAMKAAVAILPLFFSFTLASFIVDQVTEAALTCEPVLLQWQGAVGPGTLVILANGSHIENFGPFTGTSFHWPVDVPAGTVVVAQFTDSTGAVATGKPFTIGQGTTGCTSNQSQSASTSGR